MARRQPNRPSGPTAPRGKESWGSYLTRHGLTIAGGIVGSMVGGPAGGYLGGQAGNYLGNVVGPELGRKIGQAGGTMIGGAAGSALGNRASRGMNALGGMGIQNLSGMGIQDLAQRGINAISGNGGGPNGGPGDPNNPGNGGFPQTPYIQPGAIGQIPSESFWTGGSPGFGYFPQLEQDQYNASQQLLGRGMQNLQQPFQAPNLDFGPIRESARREFSQDVLPGIAERFRGMRGEATNRGSMPYLQRAGERFASDLAAQEAKYGLERTALQHGIQQTNQNQAMQMLQNGMNPRLQSVAFQGTPGALQSAASGFGQAAGYALPAIGQYAWNKYTGQQGV